MTEPLRCAVYARFSTEKQTRLSIEDQVRKCREFARRNGWAVLDAHIYVDEAISGSGSEDRAGLNRMMECALCRPRAFDAVLVDDTSRLSRHAATAMQLFERLNFAGVRVVAVSQGLDTNHEQSDVLVAVHGLVDSLYVKELAKKTHRGMEGQMLRGFHVGGPCFGYRIVPRAEGGQGSRLEVDGEQAAIVRRIFEMYVAGLGLRKIAMRLNAEKVPSPRPRARKGYGTWCPTAIREMLGRERYIGREVWNKSRFVKKPGSNKRVLRPRPPQDWRIVERPELRIVSDNLWRLVQAQRARTRELLAGYGGAWAYGRKASPYLLSGLLRCAECGANLVIVTGRGKGRYSKYGCPQFHYRGACPNNLKERHDWIEDRLLTELQKAILQSHAIEYAVEGFQEQFRAALAALPDGRDQLARRRADLATKLSNITAAIAAAGHSPALLAELARCEREQQEVSAVLERTSPRVFAYDGDSLRREIAEEFGELRRLLSTDVVAARAHLLRHVGTVRMKPVADERGKAFYVAEGEWNLLGEAPKTAQAPRSSDRDAWMVAGARFELATFGL